MNKNKNDLKLLQDAKASNGGGVREPFYKAAAVKRMMAAGYIREKPNHRTLLGDRLLIITKEGRKYLGD